MNTIMAPAPSTMMEEMRRAEATSQHDGGYFHTLAEICQQPETWRQTARAAHARRAEIEAITKGCAAIVLTGSGSSQFAAECIHPLIRTHAALTVGSGEILLQGRAALPRGKLCLVSLARSGDSPESVGVVQMLLEAAPEIRHLVVTCNANGKLAGLEGALDHKVAEEG